jgi:hypothetical protein
MFMELVIFKHVGVLMNLCTHANLACSFMDRWVKTLNIVGLCLPGIGV